MGIMTDKKAALEALIRASTEEWKRCKADTWEGAHLAGLEEAYKLIFKTPPTPAEKTVVLTKFGSRRAYVHIEEGSI